MRAVRFGQYGGPEVLEQAEVALPEPGPGQVAIDVAYVGVNFADHKARAEGYRVPSLPYVPGLEVSGRIRALGTGVEGFTVGQEVAALTEGGAYAEVVVADAVTTFPLPAGADLRTAATLPTVLPTAYALLHTVGRIGAGESVLVQGAAGGVGTVAGQLAKAAGAGRVIGVVSSGAKAAYALKYGYDDVVLADGFGASVRELTGGKGVDLALDPVGGDVLRETLGALAVFGRLVSFGNASSAPAWQVGQPELYPTGLSVSGFSILGLAQTAPQELRSLAEHAFAVPGIELPVTGEYALADAAEAHRALASRTTTGKLLLRVAA
ncbi:zinc-binding dehydrogenase [Streptomyces sp. VRA16 Mangrove soil]|uniref:quinone oxidoreductase family protein n=1 Tax=Streptomyces sp. VRA16 Mangrove soil TaxID=2817434 RepID=UPI001A9D7130|nr:zinc-binding dehydrogenase [Streptomyces sp. VRA16 Mangrove soil]MBO1337791.1 zinc-binding dehydrogenase [Streptomyces sp. VRA16 Mangrove soil]